jgi:hypothetical protein
MYAAIRATRELVGTSDTDAAGRDFLFVQEQAAGRLKEQTARTGGASGGGHPAALKADGR